MLDEEIECQIEAMSSLSRQQRTDCGIDDGKNKRVAQGKNDALYSEAKFHEAQLAEQRASRWVQFGAAAAGILLEMIFYGY